MFNKVYIEDDLKNHPRTDKILSHIKHKHDPIYLKNYDDVWGRVKKPYLQKRDKLNLFIAKKKGQKVKEAPAAYGHGKEKHFYFIHSYNCIYECEYCYLQGYFNTPDLVFFINHEEIISEMEEIIKDHPDAWFHAGEFSDSLALSHITNEMSLYFNFFKKYPKAKLEIRTKSVNTKVLNQLEPLENVFISFTLSSKIAGKKYDIKCPSVELRIKKISELVSKGFKIGIHFDPIVYHEGFEQDYNFIISKLSEALPNDRLGYISIGVVRFTKDVFNQVKQNYPDSILVKQDYIKSFDQKIRYNRPMRNWILSTVKDLLVKKQYSPEKIYLCMED